MKVSGPKTVVFCMMPTNGARHERECPWCAELILAKARLCRYCGRDVTPIEAPSTNAVATASRGTQDVATAMPTASPLIGAPSEPAVSMPLHAEVVASAQSQPIQQATGATPGAKSDSAPNVDTDAGLDIGAISVASALGARSVDSDASLARPPKAPDEKRAWYSYQRQGKDADLEGIGGWLAWFCVGQIVMVVSGVTSLWSEIGTLLTWDARGMIAMAAGGRPAILAYDATTACHVILSSVLLAFVLRSRKGAPQVALITLGAGAALFAVAAALVMFMQSGMSSADAAYKEVGDSGVSALRGLAYSLIWLQYWRKSKRVAATFGENASASRAMEPSARVELRRTALFACAAAGGLIVAASLVAAKDVQELKAAAASPPATPDSTYDVSAVLVASMRAQGGNVDSMFRAHATDKDDGAWLVNIAAKEIVVELLPNERREIAALRSMMLDRMTIEACARSLKTDNTYDVNVLTAAERKRMAELSGIAVGRRLVGRVPIDTDTVSSVRGWEIIRKYASPTDLQALATFTRLPSASSEELCTAGRTFYRVLLDVPTGTQDDRDGIYYLVNLLSGR